MTQRRSNKGDPTRAVAYLRVSTDKQEASPDVQAAAIARWAASQGVTIVASFLDEGVGGATPLVDRPGLQAALAALREHKAGVLVASKRDRFGREPALMLELERMTARRGSIMRTSDGASDAAGFAGEVQREGMDFAAKIERLAIKDRTSAALRRLQERGRAAGGRPPYGWKIVLTPDPTDERGFYRSIEIDPNEQAGLVLLLELDILRLSWAEMARRMTAAGHRPRGYRWHPRSIETILRRYRSSDRPGGRPEDAPGGVFPRA
ncbi:recombinase family protein [Nannocystis pusilla]|uniref:Recombinase family protein n=1 Tax=Nannocystis pusilla TaxID=889268 RepID=A0ABS7U416_9BACT|nr:recombinase family protein [Nannocystis pusilla]MBZ5715282.1 recombinase family protein [Nannocystis pusilla]